MTGQAKNMSLEHDRLLWYKEPVFLYVNVNSGGTGGGGDAPPPHEFSAMAAEALGR